MKDNLVQAETSISPRELAGRMAQGGIVELIDVRTAPEFQAAHVACARLSPLDRLDPQSFAKKASSPARPLYVICQSGARAAKAVEKLRAAGVEDCVSVEGGTQGWIDAGLPVVRGESKVIPIMRQVQIVAGTITAMGAALALGVDKWFAVIPLVTGGGLLFAGASGTCGMALVLARMPWNRGESCATSG
ncbi:MAG TPA: rhodanese-like domain-containing protein [Candidatus Limnocylindria bacterium]|jgi:rhodanese-related sulfurtransferase|nr:rhodanese-like domain-containing protein [Candidatus Limnocylindria bacterium]